MEDFIFKDWIFFASKGDVCVILPVAVYWLATKFSSGRWNLQLSFCFSVVLGSVLETYAEAIFFNEILRMRYFFIAIFLTLASIVAFCYSYLIWIILKKKRENKK